jgi:hypothetical protein
MENCEECEKVTTTLGQHSEGKGNVPACNPFQSRTQTWNKGSLGDW